MTVGALAFLAAGLMGALGALLPISPPLSLTWFTVARTQLNDYGFFALVMFGAAYYIVPQLTGIEFPSPKLVCAHFWVALAGLILMAAPLALAGIVEGLKLQNAQIAFMDIVKSTLPFLRVSTLGDLLLVLGHVLFLMNLGGLSLRFYRARATRAYEEVTEDLFKPAEVKA
jgi:cytochrome c oxidase cbb3-type subunit 1